MPFRSLLKKNQRLKALDEDDPEYRRAKKLFEEGWLHPNKPLPTVRAIFRLRKTYDEMSDYHMYNWTVDDEVGGGVTVSGLFFHGTNRACTLGDSKRKDVLCTKNDCSLCGIIRDSFDVNRTGSKHNFITNRVTEADDYSKNLSHKAGSRALLLNTVVYGNPNKLYYTDTSASSLRSGYHSVMGVPGGDLNYDETVVYKNEAIRPVYLVTYGRPTSSKLRKRR